MRDKGKLLSLALSLLLLIGSALTLKAQTATPRPTDTTRLIEYTQEIEGKLEPGRSAALYSFRGQQGDAVTISMKSWTFNAYLTLMDANGNEIAWDDDGGGYPDALIGPFLLPQTGDYQIRASSNESEPRGTFSLHLDRVDLVNLSLGQTVNVTFTDDEAAAYFAFEGHAGDVLNIVVDSDGSLDTRLRVRGLGESYDLAADDDSGTGFDPEISRLMIPYDNPYIVAVEPYAPGMTGSVSLTLDASPLASLDEGTQTLSLGSKRSQDVLTFEGRAGEQVRITAVVTNGRPDYLSIRISQDGEEITALSGSFVNELSFLITTPSDGRVNLLFENSTNLVLEVSLERG